MYIPLPYYREVLKEGDSGDQEYVGDFLYKSNYNEYLIDAIKSRLDDDISVKGFTSIIKEEKAIRLEDGQFKWNVTPEDPNTRVIVVGFDVDEQIYDDAVLIVEMLLTNSLHTLIASSNSHPKKEWCAEIIPSVPILTSLDAIAINGLQGDSIPIDPINDLANVLIENNYYNGLPRIIVNLSKHYDRNIVTDDTFELVKDKISELFRMSAIICDDEFANKNNLIKFDDRVDLYCPRFCISTITAERRLEHVLRMRNEVESIVVPLIYNYVDIRVGLATKMPGLQFVGNSVNVPNNQYLSALEYEITHPRLEGEDVELRRSSVPGDGYLYQDEGTREPYVSM